MGENRKQVNAVLRRVLARKKADEARVKSSKENPRGESEMAVVEMPNRQVARPLSVLVPLIKQDLEAASEAARNATMPYYKAAGEKMREAKGQLKHGEFLPWVKRHFNIGKDQASRYMSYADATRDVEKSRDAPTRVHTSLNEFVRDQGRSVGGQAGWQQPVREAMNKVDFDALKQAELKRTEERDLQRKLALQLIDIGFKALAAKLHPDRGGSREAMARLNEVRSRLKSHV